MSQSPPLGPTGSPTTIPIPIGKAFQKTQAYIPDRLWHSDIPTGQPMQSTGTPSDAGVGIGLLKGIQTFY